MIARLQRDLENLKTNKTSPKELLKKRSDVSRPVDPRRYSEGEVSFGLGLSRFAGMVLGQRVVFGLLTIGTVIRMGTSLDHTTGRLTNE